MKNDYEKMTNSEIRLRIKSMKDDYEVTKNKIAKLIYHLKELDEEYEKANSVLKKSQEIPQIFGMKDEMAKKL